MTPQDFLESVIEAEPRRKYWNFTLIIYNMDNILYSSARLKRRNLQDQHLMALQKATPTLSKGNSRTFRDLGEKGTKNSLTSLVELITN